MAPDAPTAAELDANPAVRVALESAWADSRADDPTTRHEEGGWIYLDPAVGEVSIVRAPPGSARSIDLTSPPELSGRFVVGKFHTHPNPSAEGWYPGPSPGDRRTDAVHGVPDLIRAEDGVHHCGPDRRRGGLIGNLGYPT